MRRVEGAGLLQAMVLAAVMVWSMPVGSSAAHAADPEKAAAASSDDYYTRRAKKILENEKKPWLEPHPLAASYPGMDIVVCEGGCSNGARAQVVAVQPHVETTEVTQGGYMPTSVDATSPTDVANAACIAGCFGKFRDNDLSPPYSAPNQVRRMVLPPRDKLSPIR